MKKKIKFCLMIVVCIVLVILFPILMDIFILGNDIPSNISNSDWAGFIGSYVGGIATFALVFGFGLNYIYPCEAAIHTASQRYIQVR